MLTRLAVKNFKSFEEAELELGHFTILIGANASGKSNIGDALKFLKGINLGFSILETIQAPLEQSAFDWIGIRGGIQEICFNKNTNFYIAVDFKKYNHYYGLGYNIDSKNQVGGALISVYDGMITKTIIGKNGDESFISPPIPYDKNTKLKHSSKFFGKKLNILQEKRNAQVHQKQSDLEEEIQKSDIATLEALKEYFGNTIFLDLNPISLKKPSHENYKNIFGDGRFLPSALKYICTDYEKKSILVSWMNKLIDTDVVDLEFDTDRSGFVTMYLKEKSGHVTSMYSASDGTLRFLGMLAALFHPEPAKIYFIEEIDTGIHPTRLQLLLQLIEKRTKKMGFQVIATTHAPQILDLVSPETLQDASIVYRSKKNGSSKIRKLVDIPRFKENIENKNSEQIPLKPSRLHETGWFETMLELVDNEE